MSCILCCIVARSTSSPFSDSSGSRNRPKTKWEPCENRIKLGGAVARRTLPLIKGRPPQPPAWWCALVTEQRIACRISTWRLFGRSRALCHPKYFCHCGHRYLKKKKILINLSQSLHSVQSSPNKLPRLCL